ncbi:AraC family transcriptional regulator [Mucilaginibacter sp. JRF]|uniref:AraC family transcriptional regulator n=1 Tax=Mucilaginibacter sp. JRF TaxID=2780088 RepID=UPI00187EBB84|nr:helix-turn-helix transcriptional regulator [Mucilaginibacter sp. JRF]MBE9584003.1 AraC family transcriptional regulator [Mucilaginibacter sp. JRF]
MSIYWSSPNEIMLPCIQEKYFKQELISGDHSFGRIISGEVNVLIAEKTHVLNAGDTFFCPRNQLCTFIKTSKDGKPYSSIMISLRAERLKDFYTRHNIAPVPKHHHGIRQYNNHPLLESFFGSILPYFGLDGEIPPPIVSVKIEEAITILRTLDADIDRCLANFSIPGKIDLPDFMEKNFMFNMPLQKFAYFTGRSLTTFKTDFKKAFSISPQRWLTQKRLELAHYQLSEQKRKPVDIYLEAGFENLSHFSFAFKKHFGYAPTLVTGTS